MFKRISAVLSSSAVRSLSLRRLLGAVLVSGVTALAFMGLFVLRMKTSPSAARFAGATTSSQPSVLWRAPSFTLTAQDGQVRTDQQLRGKPYIADFIFTQCRGACPVMTARLVLLQRQLADRDLRFISFSVDPDHDTPRALGELAHSFGPTDARWSLLATDHQSLPRLTDGFRVAADRTGDPSAPILHSEVFFLVDAQGQVRGVYSSHDDADLERLRDASRTLASRWGGGAAARQKATSLYEDLGCGGCHSQGNLAPPLVNLMGAERMLDGGTRRTIDAAYLRSSILEPGRDVVAGYPPIMPSYAGKLSEQELAALIAELSSRQTTAKEPPAVAALVADPVCHMQVRVDSSTPHVRDQGHDVYFCSEICKTAFAKDPTRYRAK